MARTQERILSVRESREREITNTIEEIIADHAARGFVYPFIEAGGFRLRLPFRVDFVHENIREPFDPLFEFDGTRALLDMYGIFDKAINAHVVELVPGDYVDPKAAHGHRTMLEISEGYRATLREIQKDELRAELSRLAGRYLVHETMRAHPGTWLTHDSLTARLVREGLWKYFYHFYHRTTHRASEDVWGHLDRNPNKETAISPGSDFFEEVGFLIVEAALTTADMRALEWFVRNAPESEDREAMSKLPLYRKRALKELSRS